MSVPAYPAYRDSGVAWIGRVPVSWNVRRLRFLADVRPSGVDKHSVEGELPVQLCNYVDVYKSDRITDALTFLGATATSAEIERFALRAGDVLITKDSETPNDIAVAALVEPSAAGTVCGYHLALLRPTSGVIEGAFLFWAFKATETLAQCSVRAQGITRFGLSTGAIADVVLALPSLAEQRAIVAFLDRECGKIDGLVAEQERLIGLLKEKRQAVISHAVTKGLDPNAPMKDSGVAWLGQVPAHWSTRPLKHIARFVGGATPRKDRTDYWQGDIPWVSPKDMKKWIVTGEADFITREAMEASNLTLVPPGSVLIVVRGMILAHSFPVALTGRPLTLNQDMKALLPTDGHCTPYLGHLLAAHQAVVAQHVDEAGHGTRALRMEGFTSLPLPVPPPEEQVRIATFVGDSVEKLMQLSAEAERAIALLKERRAALISAAVTGKIDVRGLVAPPEAQAA